jgi:transposase
MRQKSEATKVSSEQVVREIRRATRKQYSAEEKTRAYSAASAFGVGT